LIQQKEKSQAIFAINYKRRGISSEEKEAKKEKAKAGCHPKF
jgi:hypothetical protein